MSIWGRPDDFFNNCTHTGKYCGKPLAACNSCEVRHKADIEERKHLKELLLQGKYIVYQQDGEAETKKREQRILEYEED